MALDARRILKRLHDPGRRPVAWASPRFQDDVATVHRQLLPSRSRAVLAEAFAREAFQSLADRPSVRSEPTRVAYALRWQELGPQG